MALPTAYTEDTFASYLDFLLGDLSGALAWSPDAGSYAEIINETLIAYGADTIESITGLPSIVKLRTIGRWQLWHAVVAGAAKFYDYHQNQEQFDLSKLFEHAQSLLKLAEQDVRIYGLGPWAVGRQTVHRIGEPRTGRLPHPLYPEVLEGLIDQPGHLPSWP